MDDPQLEYSARRELAGNLINFAEGEGRESDMPTKKRVVDLLATYVHSDILRFIKENQFEICIGHPRGPENEDGKTVYNSFAKKIIVYESLPGDSGENLLKDNTRIIVGIGRAINRSIILAKKKAFSINSQALNKLAIPAYKISENNAGHKKSSVFAKMFAVWTEFAHESDDLQRVVGDRICRELLADLKTYHANRQTLNVGESSSSSIRRGERGSAQSSQPPVVSPSSSSWGR